MSKLNLILLGICLILGALLWSSDAARGRALARIAARDSSIAILTGQVDSLTAARQPQLVAYDRWLTRWDTLTKFDTLRLTDTVCVTVEKIVTRDSTIRSGAALIATDNRLLAKQDTLADSLRFQVADLRRVAKGPFLRPSAEILVSGPHIRVAGQLEAGRRLSAVARLEVDTTSRFWGGLHYQFWSSAIQR